MSQNLWKPVPNRPGLESAPFNNLPEAYKSFIKIGEDGKRFDGKDPLDNKEYTYKVNYSDQYSAWGVLRWEKKGSGGSRFAPNISVGCQLVDVDKANTILQSNKSTENTTYWKITGNPIVITENEMVEGVNEPFQSQKVKVVLELVLKKSGQPQQQEQKKQTQVAQTTDGTTVQS